MSSVCTGDDNSPNQLSDRVFLGAVLMTGFTYAALFAYLGGATYILQGIYGLSPQGYSLVFGLNSLGFMACGYLAGRTSRHWSQRGTLAIGIAMCATGALGLLATETFDLPLPMVSSVAVTSPPSTSLALAGYPELAGTASSVLGLARFAFGGLAAPLVGLGGANTILPPGLVTAASAALATAAFALLSARTPHAPSCGHRGQVRLPS